jgi:hypothetical protein
MKITEQTPFILEVPEELLEPIFLIPTELSTDLIAPIIKVERRLTRRQIEDMVKEGDRKLDGISKLLNAPPLNYQYSIPGIKEKLIRKDLLLLVQLVTSMYWFKIRDVEFDQLYQVVEIDWSYRDLYPGDTEIYYELFTKRDIHIRDNPDVQKET